MTLPYREHGFCYTLPLPSFTNLEPHNLIEIALLYCKLFALLLVVIYAQIWTNIHMPLDLWVFALLFTFPPPVIRVLFNFTSLTSQSAPFLLSHSLPACLVPLKTIHLYSPVDLEVAPCSGSFTGPRNNLTFYTTLLTGHLSQGPLGLSPK